MDSYGFFIDESGSADPKTFAHSPCFTLCGILITAKNRRILKVLSDELKMKYFGSKKFIFHSAQLRFQLRRNNKSLSAFTNDFKAILQNCSFWVVFTVVHKKKAFDKGWDAIHVYQQSYKVLLANLLKFLYAKNIKGEIYAEASSASQDSYLYNAFFHLIRRGIERLGITNKLAKQYFTSLSYVTKPNNDIEEQLADILSMYGRLRMAIESNERLQDDLDCFEKLVYSIASKRLLAITNASNPKKVALYAQINPFKKLP